MVPTEIILASVSSPFEIGAQIAEIIIAAGTIVGLGFSIWFSRRTLQRSDWNSIMTTAPSIAIECRSDGFWLNDRPTAGGSWGEPTRHLEPSGKYVTFALRFRISNQGRGLALAIKPEVSCKAKAWVGGIQNFPVWMGTDNEDKSDLAVDIQEEDFKWLELMKNPLHLALSISYKNDQGNIACTSRWSANLQPFTVNGTRLEICRDRIQEPSMQITYS